MDGVQDEGDQVVRWDGIDREGQAVSAGLYVVRVEAGGETRFAKMMMVK